MIPIDLSKFGSEERIILEMLGLKKSTKTNVNAKRKSAYTKFKNAGLVPYKLMLTTECCLCKTKKTEFFNMVSTSEESGLVSQRTLDQTVDENTRFELRFSRTCTSCKKELMRLPKEELVNLIIEQIIKW